MTSITKKVHFDDEVKLQPLSIEIAAPLAEVDDEKYQNLAARIFNVLRLERNSETTCARMTCTLPLTQSMRGNRTKKYIQKNLESLVSNCVSMHTIQRSHLDALRFMYNPNMEKPPSMEKPSNLTEDEKIDYELKAEKKRVKRENKIFEYELESNAMRVNCENKIQRCESMITELKALQEELQNPKDPAPVS